MNNEEYQRRLTEIVTDVIIRLHMKLNKVSIKDVYEHIIENNLAKDIPEALHMGGMTVYIIEKLKGF